MKNITFSAQEESIEQARKIAARRHQTLNELFREWLEYLNHHDTDNTRSDTLEMLWERTNYLHVGKRISRDEMNER